ncbi:hypothetical protein [Hominenteromicrobium sp.]|uniref:hypothetical protein n=1 Tax=Hominenteromicrobium sp. TaxID=3073581 RepID=UPI003AB8C2E3
MSDQNKTLFSRDDVLEECMLFTALRLYENARSHQTAALAERLNEEHPASPDSTEIQEFTKRMNRQLRTVYAPQRRKAWRKRLGRVAVIFLVLFTLTSISILSVEAFRIPVLNYILHITEKSTQFNMKDITDEEWRSKYTGEYLPEMLPDQYFFSAMDCLGDDKYVEFRGPDEKFISYMETTESITLSWDTEDAAQAQKITLDGQDYFVIEKADIRQIAWEVQGKMLKICSNDTDTDMMEFVKHIKNVK